MIQLGDDKADVLRVYSRTLGMDHSTFLTIAANAATAGHAKTKAAFEAREEDFDWRERKTTSRLLAYIAKPQNGEPGDLDSALTILAAMSAGRAWPIENAFTRPDPNPNPSPSPSPNSQRAG